MKRSQLTALAFVAMLSIPTLASAQFQAKIDNMRSYDQTGINVFEAPKDETPFDGLRYRLGFSFVQPFQMLDHKNNGNVRMDTIKTFAFPTSGTTPTVKKTGYDVNKLKEIGADFNNAVANMNIDVQLAQGVRLSLISYMSARHHQETWVKGGFIQFDALPFLPFGFVDDVMKYTTIRVGHMEINYGDSHFRRTDNGNALYNPFVENYLMDAFSTEIGGEVLVRHAGFLGLIGITNGEVKGDVTTPDYKAPAFFFKGGYDGKLTDDLRVRLTGSLYMTEKAANATLYDGDRGGSHYYYVMEAENILTKNATPNTQASASATSQFTSGRVTPELDSKLLAFVINPYVEFMGFEFFGNYEVAKGTKKSDKAAIATPNSTPATIALDTEEREWTQIAGDLLYRFGGENQYWVGGRYNTVTGRPYKATADVTVDRFAFSGGWFLTKSIMAKAEYVQQTYTDFPANDIRNGGEFNGVVIEAVIGF